MSRDTGRFFLGESKWLRCRNIDPYLAYYFLKKNRAHDTDASQYEQVKSAVGIGNIEYW